MEEISSQIKKQISKEQGQVSVEGNKALSP
jgi:hypothetical protein